jgi:hypothetical protein
LGRYTFFYYCLLLLLQDEADLLPQLHWTIHSICMASTSPYHVRSLVDQGILSSWKRALEAIGEEESPGGEDLFLPEWSSRLSLIDQELTERATQPALI